MRNFCCSPLAYTFVHLSNDEDENFLTELLTSGGQQRLEMKKLLLSCGLMEENEKLQNDGFTEAKGNVNLNLLLITRPQHLLFNEFKFILQTSSLFKNE